MKIIELQTPSIIESPKSMNERSDIEILELKSNEIFSLILSCEFGLIKILLTILVQIQILNNRFN